MRSEATTVAEYLAGLPESRREVIQAVRQVILQHLDRGFVEEMHYGMIGYVVPHSLYPAGYHCDPKQPLPFASLASQKNAMSLYLMCLYIDPIADDLFRSEWAQTGLKMDMGKSCIRFKKLEDLPLDLIGKEISRVTAQQYIGGYEAVLAKSRAEKKKKSR